MAKSMDVRGRKPSQRSMAERVGEALDEYIKFQFINLEREHAKEAILKSLQESSGRYSDLDKRFLALTHSTAKHNLLYTGIDNGVGIGFMLVRGAGLGEKGVQAAINLVKSQDFGVGVADREKQELVERLPLVKSINDVPRTHAYEAAASIDFFSFLGVKGPETVRELISENGMSVRNTRILVQHNQQMIKSPRATNRVVLVDTKTGESKASYLIKIPHKPAELDAAVYAGSRVVTYSGGEKTLGPKVYPTGDYVIEEDLTERTDTMRWAGFTLTDEEALALGRQNAMDLKTMFEDRRYLYFTKQMTNIRVGGKGAKNLFTQMVDWSDAVDISEKKGAELSQLVEKYIEGDAFIMRGELLRDGPNTKAWAAYVGTLTDPKIVEDERARWLFSDAIRTVETRLTNKNYRIMERPIGEDARHWADFFDDARREPLMWEESKQYVSHKLMAGDKGLINLVSRTLSIDLQRVGILAPDVASALVDDLINRVRIQDKIRMPPNDFKGIVDRCMVVEDVPAEDRRRVLRPLIKAVSDMPAYTFPDVEDPLSEAFKDKVDKRTASKVITRVKNEMDIACAKLVSFTSMPGEVSWLRPWAHHILVHGPEPNKEVLMVYRFKPTHTRSPDIEIVPSETASKEDTGPKIIWSDDKQGFILEEYINGASLEGIGEVEARGLGRSCAGMVYRMFSLGRFVGVGKSIHNFGGFERGHFMVRREGRSLKPCLVDYGESTFIRRDNRMDYLTPHIGTLLDQMRFWPHGEQAWAAFERRLEYLAQRRDTRSHLRADLEAALKENRRYRTHDINRVLIPKYAEFFRRVDEVKKFMSGDNP